MHRSRARKLLASNALSLEKEGRFVHFFCDGLSIGQRFPRFEPHRPSSVGPFRRVVNLPNRANPTKSLELPVQAPDLVAVTVMALFAFAEGVALTQSDGDLFAHIRLGQIILGGGGIPETSVLGFSFGATAVYPAWLAAVWFAALHRVGGLALIVAATAVVAGLAHGAVSILFRRRGLSFTANFFASLLGLALAASHWLARPHEFTLLFAALLLVLLETAAAWVPAACTVMLIAWANQHGGWAFGLVMIGCYLAGDAIELLGNSGSPVWRTRLRRHGLALIGAILASFCTPYGFRLHQAVLTTLSDRSVATLINEYQPPGLSALPDILFFGVLALSVIAVLGTRRRPAFPALVTIVITAVFAMRAGRNIALFGLVAWPLIALHVLRPRFAGDDLNIRDRRPGTVRVGLVAAPFACLLLLIGALHGSVAGQPWIADSVDGDRFPVVAVNRLREDRSEARTLTTWVWSGYVPYAWPGKRVFFDPLLFDPAILDRFGRMLLTQAGWRDQLTESGIGVVLVPPGVPLADSLAIDVDWTQWHRDSTAVVFARRTPQVVGQ